MIITTQNNSYTVTNSNASIKAAQAGSTRVKDSSGQILACVKMHGRSDVLGYVRKHPQSEQRKSFVQQLRDNAVSETDIQELLRIPNKQK